MRDRKRELKIFIIIISLYIFLVIWGILFANRLETLLNDPLLTPEEWCQEHPCLTLNIFGIIVTLAVPTSTFFVYLLGVETVIIGIFIAIRSNEHKSQLWWGIALILWGLGALFAGTSYQAFSYELKCANRTFCIWTTWFEIMYLISSVGSINAMVIAQKYSYLPEKYHHIADIYAIGNFSVYSIITLIGAYLPIRFLISFELMILFLAPNILIFLILNSWRYVRHKKRMDRNLMVIWCSLIIIIGLYFLYYSLGITEFFWQLGFWFSANDILHIGLIIWMGYIYFTVLQMPSIEDLGGITNSIGKVEWSNMLDLAHDYGWLFNIYTLTRFLEKVDQTLIESGHKRLKLRSKWHKLEEKGAFLSRLGLDWKKQSLQRVGKTKSDIIDCFAKFNNKPRTSMAVFDYLSQVDPEHYDKQRENDIDLLRVRNVISRLNRAGYIEKIKGEQGVRYFKLNLVVSER